jgi:PAB-dependent poly(A)-specific ribonuclease subunit 2
MDLNLNTGYPLSEYIELQTLYESQFGVSISAAAFDLQQELFWTGTEDGRMTSYYGGSLAKYTSFKVPTEMDPDIKMIYPHRTNNVFVLTSDSISSYNRFGLNLFRHKEVSFQNLQSMFYNQQDRFFLGGFSEQIYDFDIERLRVLRQITISDDQKDCIIIKSSSASPINISSSRNGLLCTGSTSGQIILRDAYSLKCLHRLQPHSGSLSDFDVHGNYLASCGFSSTRTGNLCVDRFLMIYDLRMLRALSPIQLHIEPCFLHYLPMCSNVIAIGSQSGCFQITDINVIAQATFYQAQVPPLGLATTFSMSENSQAFAFGHSSGSVHLFSNNENTLFNDYSEQTVFIDPPQLTSSYIDINNEIAPLSSVPVPIIENAGNCISDWPKELTKYEYRPQPSLPNLSNTRVIHGITSVPNRMNIKRNQIYNQAYMDEIKELEKKITETSIPLELMCENCSEGEVCDIESNQVLTAQSNESGEGKSEKVEN